MFTFKGSQGGHCIQLADGVIFNKEIPIGNNTICRPAAVSSHLYPKYVQCPFLSVQCNALRALGFFRGSFGVPYGFHNVNYSLISLAGHRGIELYN